MAPIPEEISSERPHRVHEKTVVISGMSGAYPKSHHIADFSKILYNEVDPVAESQLRWNYNHPEVPPYAGTVPDLDRFDAQFFKVNNQLAKCMDPMSRKIKEHVYRAIYDAGLSADHLSGKKIGVFVGTSLSESEKAFYYDIDNVSPSSLPGCSKAMFANRISYWLNLTGPSMAIDDSCASSMVALEQAYQAIKRGDCEAAIVAGANITIHPQSIIHYGRIIPLCKDGKTKSFDQNADGCVKSEAICVLFLQKVQDALRIYAEVVYAKNEFDFAAVDDNALNGFYRNSKQLADFMKVFYQEAKVSPSEIEYVEGFGSGSSDADKAELEAIEEAFCTDRCDPLLVGSVTSNIGYTEAASGLCGVTKVLLGYQKGMLAANLHCSQPRQDVAALRDGRMRVVTKQVPFGRSYAAITGLSATGINSHVLLRGYYVPKKTTIKYDIPRLITISGRQESAVQAIIDDLSMRPIDAEEVALLHNIHEEKNTGHLGRGFALLDSKEKGETVCLATKVEHFDDVKRPLWFVYSGMGSQWAGMGKQLMRIPVFAAAIERCNKVLQPRGLDIVHIITSSDKTIFDNILHSFVGIAAVQIGLTDVLRTIGIIPDKIIGHSLGELGCGYADGCLTAEEMVLLAYIRGIVSLQTKLITGSMAAVGIGYQQAVKMCPAEIEVACHNGPESCTISGPADAMREFVAKLSAQGIFAKEVLCSNIAYHSSYISEAGPKLLEYSSEVIKSPKRRSERWVSTSVPQERWGEENAQYCSAGYYTNNVLNPVLFEEASRLVPAGAVLVEVAPHGLLQAILKRSLPDDCRHIPLTKRGHTDNTLYFLQAIGQLYMQGCNPKLKNLYPKVQFPVSTETPSLSHLIEWNRSDLWVLPTLKQVKKERATICTSLISKHDTDSNYLRGNVVKGKNVYPFSAVLVSVWDTLAMSTGVTRSELSVQFRDVQLFAQPLLLDKRHLQLKVTIQIGSGEFEVVTPFSKVATGNISQYMETLPKYEFITHDKQSTLESEHIYKLFEERDYSYSGDFCSIYKSNYSFTEAQLLWEDNWATLIEGMLQLNAIQRDHDNVSQPSRIHNLIVDLKTHESYKTVLDSKTVIPAVVSPIFDYTRCGGILMEKLQFLDFPLLKTNDFDLQTMDFTTKKNGSQNVRSKCNVSLQSQHIGSLKTLSWVTTNTISSVPSEELVTVQFAGISMYDVNVAMGVILPKQGYENRKAYGMEYSGTTDRGERVMGLVRGGAASKRVKAVPGLTWPVPALWTLEEAATVPLAYAQAFYCLGIKAQLQPGMTVLVHGGAGALGQAVISIALALQCKVFTTVADENKKKFLLKLFPALSKDVIGSSRDDSFTHLVLDATNGEGCDIIVSCVTGDLKNDTLKCAGFCGITLDVAQAHIEDTFSYGMSFMTRQRSYVQVDFFSIFENEEYVQAVQLMLSEGITRGYVRPLTRVTYAAQESTRAFRLLAASQHRGRVLLHLPRDLTPMNTRLSCSPEHHQLVVCREETLSLQFVGRLIKSGARKILLHFPRPSSMILYKIRSWKNHGVEVNTLTMDLNENSIKQIFNERNIEGIFTICTGNKLDQRIISDLNIATKTLCPTIKYFFIISTETTLDENLCHTRSEMGLPTTIISLEKVLNVPSSYVYSRSSLLEVFDNALASEELRSTIMKVDIKRNARASLLQDIAELADINVPDNIGTETTLQEMGLNNRYVKAVSVILQCLYHISIPDDQIPKLTVKVLREMDRCLREPEFNQVVGLPALFTHVADDELLGTANMVVLPTLVKSLTVNEGEVDLSQQYLCVVGGVEGQHARFRTLCARLQLPALVLQPLASPQQETFQDTARRYVQVLTTRTNLKKYNDFYLLGYESGVLTALEMAAILEKEGLKGTVFCLGGSPEEVLQYIKSNLINLDTEDKLQTALIQHMAGVMSNEPVESINTLLEKESSLQDKLDDCLRVLMKNVPHTTPYARAIIEAAFARIQQALQHKVQAHTLQSRVVLLRASSSFIDKSCNVKALSQEPVITYDIDAPLMYATEHPKCASVINSHLSAELLEAYKLQNHCDVYASAEDIFHTSLDEE